MDLKIKRSNIYLAIAFTFVFIKSYVLLGWYTGGDQVHYHKLYDSLAAANFSEIMALSLSLVSGAEPIYAHLMWVGAQLNFDKNIYISIFNSTLITGLFVFLRANKAPFFIYILVITNFYVLVLLTSAERLKFAYLMLVLAACVAATPGKALMLAASPFGHLQAFIMLPSIFLAYIESDIKKLVLKFKLNVRNFKYLALPALVIAAVVAMKIDSILPKALIYLQQDQSYMEVLNLVALTFVALVATRNRFRMTLVLLPMFPAVQLLGGDRVNMIAITLVFYYLTIEHRLNHPILVLMLIYFSIRGILRVKWIFNYGHGYMG